MKISAGSYDLNKWLEGGYDCDIITTLFGGAGSGKTNFCMTATASCAKKDGKVIFVDTEGSFSSDRLKQITKENFDKTSKNILILNPTSFEEQWDAFGRLLKELKSNIISLIVVDGMTMLYRLKLAECKEDKIKIREINGILARQMRMLAEISRKKHIPIIITNQVYSDFGDGEVKMVGGDILKYWSKCIIEIKNEKGKRTAILRKHRSLGEKEICFEIFDGGIRKKGWL